MVHLLRALTQFPLISPRDKLYLEMRPHPKPITSIHQATSNDSKNALVLLAIRARACSSVAGSFSSLV